MVRVCLSLVQCRAVPNNWRMWIFILTDIYGWRLNVSLLSESVLSSKGWLVPLSEVCVAFVSCWQVAQGWNCGFPAESQRGAGGAVWPSSSGGSSSNWLTVKAQSSTSTTAFSFVCLFCFPPSVLRKGDAWFLHQSGLWRDLIHFYTILSGLALVEWWWNKWSVTPSAPNMISLAPLSRIGDPLPQVEFLLREKIIIENENLN